MSVSISCGYMPDPGSDIQLAFFFGAVKRDWLLILALQTTFNVHNFFYVVLELVPNLLPYTAAMMIIIVKNTIKSFAFFLACKNFLSMDKKLTKSKYPEFSMKKVL
jgi:hypothetical protein